MVDAGGLREMARYMKEERPDGTILQVCLEATRNVLKVFFLMFTMFTMFRGLNTLCTLFQREPWA